MARRNSYLIVAHYGASAIHIPLDSYVSLTIRSFIVLSCCQILNNQI